MGGFVSKKLKPPTVSFRFRYFLDHGADVNRTHLNGWTALMMACELGHTETVRLLLDHGADVNRTDNKAIVASFKQVFGRRNGVCDPIVTLPVNAIIKARADESVWPLLSGLILTSDVSRYLLFDEETLRVDFQHPGRNTENGLTVDSTCPQIIAFLQTVDECVDEKFSFCTRYRPIIRRLVKDKDNGVQINKNSRVVIDLHEDIHVYRSKDHPPLRENNEMCGVSTIAKYDRESTRQTLREAQGSRAWYVVRATFDSQEDWNSDLRVTNC